MKIRDRIKSLRRIRAGDLIPNPANWRMHSDAQRSALRGVLEKIGYADAVLARETKDGLMLIDGHLRCSETPDEKVPVLVLDVTEEEAKVLLATIDPLAAMAEADAGKLDALLAEVGSVTPEVDAMLAELAGIDGEPLQEGWGETPDNKNQAAQSTVCFLGLYVQDVADFERLIADVSIAGESPIETVKRGLHAINGKR